MDAVDCLGFAGGFTVGMVQAGFHLRGKREFAAGFGMPACEANRHVLGHDWDAQCSDHLEWQPHQVPVVFGNPPCSGFSLMSDQKVRGMDSKINDCMWQFVGFAARCAPYTVIMESVGQAFTQGRPLMQRLREDMERRTGKTWWLTHVMQDAYSLGGVAIRKRYMMVLHQYEFGVEPVELQRPLPTFGDAIMDLADLPLEWGPQPYRSPAHSLYAANHRSETGVVDGHYGLDCLSNTRVTDLLNRVPVEWWPEGERLEHVLEVYWREYGDLPPGWVMQYGNTEKMRRRHAEGDFWQGMNQPRRWARDRAGRVITGAALGQVVHPTLPRMITHREALRVMGFPDDWRVESLNPKKHSPYWGKGITVQVGKWIGQWTKSSLEGNPGSLTGELIGDRERLIDISRNWRSHACNRGIPHAPLDRSVALA